MKKYITTLLVALLVLAGSSAFAQCSASFTTSQNFMNTTFSNNSAYSGTNPAAKNTYVWDFGDGNTQALIGWGSNALHTYAANGTYTVTLTMTTIDSLTNNVICSDVSSQSITVNLSCQSTYNVNNTLNSYSFFCPAYVYNNPNVSIEYDWDFGDGVTILNGNATETHVYTYNGNYNACLIITYRDANSNIICSDNYCSIINVTTGVTVSCTANYGHYSAPNADIIFNNFCTVGAFTTNVNYTYTYDFGDGSPVSVNNLVANTVHSYAAPGAYNACLTMDVYDAVSNNLLCTNTYCNTVNVYPAFTGCEALFTVNTDSIPANPNYYFDATPSFAGGNNTIVSYAWDFGDNTTGSGFAMNHTYATPGIYNVCLTITTSNNCSDTYCLLVKVQNPLNIANGNTLWGTLTPAGYTIVYMIEYDPNLQSLYAIGSTKTYPNSAGYYFNNFTTNPFLLKAAYNIYDNNYGTHLPTYYNASALWNGGTNVTVPLNTAQQVNINMLSGTPLGGPGFVGGSVITGANKTAGVGDPKVKLDILLFDVTANQFIANTRTDINGEYTFSNVPVGTYKVFVEELGKTMTAADITISTSNATFNNVHFESNSTENHPFIALSLDEIAGGVDNYRLTPNPAKEYFNITGLTGKEKVTILNLSGQLIRSFEANTQGVQQFSLEDIQAGMYILKVENAGYYKNFKLMVTH